MSEPETVTDCWGKRLTSRLAVRGRDATVQRDPQTMLVVALLALDDPRIDAVLQAFDVVLYDAWGDEVWPTPRTS